LGARGPMRRRAQIPKRSDRDGQTLESPYSQFANSQFSIS
jgi:hypothetical protein